MAGTAQNNLLCYKGEAVVFNFVHKELGAIVNVTGWAIVLTVKAKATDVTALFTATATIIDGPNGAYQLTLASGQTNIAAGAYAYDIWRTDSGSEAILSIGTFVIQQDVRL